MMCLTEEIDMSARLRSGMSYHAIGCGLNVKESTVQYLQKTEDACQSVCERVLESAQVLSIYSS